MDTSEIDVNQWKEVNKCETDAAFNSDKTDIICVCPDKSTCREKNGVKVGCPCKEITQQLLDSDSDSDPDPDPDSDSVSVSVSDFFGIPIWGLVLIILGIILLIISVGYLLKKIYNKKPAVRPVALKPTVNTVVKNYVWKKDLYSGVWKKYLNN
jgi:hypothetical protein